jgi:hypothetical protein
MSPRYAVQRTEAATRTLDPHLRRQGRPFHRSALDDVKALSQIRSI